jgi:hypothetical protein
MVNREMLRKAFSEAPDKWFGADELSQILDFTGKPSEIESELNNLYDVLPGPLGFESISPGSTKVVVMRPDRDGSNRYHLASSLTSFDHASLVNSFVSEALRVRPSQAKESLAWAALALEQLAKALEG